MLSLDLEEPGIFPTQFHEFIVPSFLDYSPLFNEVYAINRANCGKAMADDNRGFILS